MSEVTETLALALYITHRSHTSARTARFAPAHCDMQDHETASATSNPHGITECENKQARKYMHSVTTVARWPCYFLQISTFDAL